jgi:hypothetical protein
MRAREWRKLIEAMKREHEEIGADLIVRGEALKKEKEIEAEVHYQTAETLGKILAADNTEEDEEEENGADDF